MGESSFDLGSLISALSEDPKTLSAIAGLMDSLKTPKKQTERQVDDNAFPEADKLKGLLGMLTQGGNALPPKSRQTSPLARLFGSKEEVRCRIALLSALKPYLSESRCEKLDTVIKLLKLSELGELSQLTGLFDRL